MAPTIAKTSGDIPIDEFFELRKDFQHRLSPSGRYLAQIRRHPNRYTLAITDLAKAEQIHETIISETYPRNLQWLSDRRLTFNKAGSIFVVNIDGTEQRNLVDNIYDGRKEFKSLSAYRKRYRHYVVENTLPNEPEYILVRSQGVRGFESIHRINVFTGEKEDLYDGDKYNIHHWMIDANGLVRLAVRNSRDTSSYYQLDKKKLRRVDLGDNKLNFNYEGKTFLSARAIPISAADLENNLYVIENLTDDKFRLTSYNFTSGDSTVLLSDDHYDVGDASDEPKLLFNPGTSELAGVQYHRAKWHSHWFDSELKSIQQKLDNRYPDNLNLVIEWTADRKEVLFRSSSEKSFGKTLVYLPLDNRVLVQTNGTPSIAPELLASTKIVRFNTPDDQQIEAFLTIPNEAPEATPLIVYPHGGPFARTIFGYEPYAQYFASRGYAVIQPNFRGSTGYGREHLMRGKGSIHELMISDIKASADWAINEELVDPGRVFVFGFSYGGYAAVMSTIQHPGFYKAAVSYAAPLDIRAQLNHYQRNKYHLAYEYWNEMVLLQDKSSALKRKLSPKHHIQRIATPTLIFHGDKDPVVPYLHAQQFKESLEKKANPFVKVLKLKDERHGIRLKSNKIYFTEKAEALFQSN